VTLKVRAYSYLGAFSAGCALLAGCTPADGTIPAPPPATSAPASATPPETTQQREERLAYEAAEKAYRTFAAEYARLQQQVEGTGESTKVMRDNAAGPYLKAMNGFLRTKAKRGTHSDSAVRIAYILPGGYSPDELILLVCQDGSNVKVLDSSNKMVRRGTVSKLNIYLRPISGRWKLWSAHQEVVKSCAA
jgi:hypothetical protein